MANTSENTVRDLMSFSTDSYRSLLKGARDMQKTQSNEDLIEPDRKRQRKGDVFRKLTACPYRAHYECTIPCVRALLYWKFNHIVVTTRAQITNQTQYRTVVECKGNGFGDASRVCLIYLARISFVVKRKFKSKFSKK